MTATDPPAFSEPSRGKGTKRGRAKLEKTPPDASSVDPSDERSRSLDENAYQGLAGFRHALRRFLAFSEVAASAAGVTSQQYQAMLAIRVHPDQAIMIKELARQMLLQPNGAVQLVDRLVGAGLAERRQSSTDRRSVLVVMTDKGAALLERLAADHLQEMSKHEPLLAESLRRLRSMERSGDTS
ncbi:MarR family transcriptional regulator [Mesorhizobium sp. ESP7-2]|uniref:MarR family transcriptional regulator n=1 Tax=Mesorhizobium sp. ESP7-2 TaxID=2876622 RepID=UPI001CC932F4|nr:MarR family transcriptional regulator [Mesorhizobium sp. ESP7-2]MBZ9706306.1 MarR family transcriptional regulator [Mesorhizobium sp. ESP7-2]